MIYFEKAMELLSHKDFEIRKAVLEYLVDTGTQELGVTKKAIEMYQGAKNNYERAVALDNMLKLPHDLETLCAIPRLYNDESDRVTRKVFERFDLELLQALIETKEIRDCYKQIFSQRVAFRTEETDRLWAMLWEHSDKVQGMDYNEQNYAYAEMMIRELGRREDFPYNDYWKKIKEYDSDYESWDDVYLCILAGELRSEESIPFLIEALKEDQGDVLDEVASEALKKMKSENALSLIKENFLTGSDGFKIFTAIIFEGMQTEVFERAALELFLKEDDLTLKSILAFNMLRSFSLIGLNACLDMMKMEYDSFIGNIESELYILHVVHGIEHRHMNIWKEQLRLGYLRSVKLYETNIDNLLNLNKEEALSALETFKNRIDEKEKIQQKYNNAKSIGRNDPCPCGSGQKYKRCCGKN